MILLRNFGSIARVLLSLGLESLRCRASARFDSMAESCSTPGIDCRSRLVAQVEEGEEADSLSLKQSIGRR
ncbi:hypothetical protein BY996DRAFT_6704924 [Phakopsora pachyrhizi]|nr:hypothetical protein BY996DRAFT_6704924 [Phakopsora pachyrhizi]